MNRNWPLAVLLLATTAAGCLGDPLTDEAADLKIPLRIENARGTSLSVEVTLEPEGAGGSWSRTYTVPPGQHEVDVFELKAGSYWLVVEVDDMETRVLGDYGIDTTHIDVQVLPDGIASGPSV